MNIADIFEASVNQWPQRIAIIDKDDREYSFDELHSLVMMQLKIFQSRGIKEGDRVMVFVPMSIELYVSVLALFYAGATAVFLDEWVNRKRLDYCCEMAHCRGFIASAKIRFLAITSKSIRNIPLWFKLPATQVVHEKKQVPFDASAKHPALITFTTGSTGQPKAAIRTHEFLKAQFDALMPLTTPFPEHPSGPDMPMLPIVLLLNLGNGVTSVIADFKASKPQEFDASKIWNQIAKHQVVSLTTSPYYSSLIANAAPNKQHSLKRMILGGAPVFPDLVSNIQAKNPGVETIAVYGSSEAEPISHLIGDALIAFHQQVSPQEGLLAGIPDTNTKIAIVSLDYKYGDAFSPLTNANEIGEICVSGAHVLQDYLNPTEATRQQKIWVGNQCWHLTGDAGHLNGDGQLFLLGRCQRIINFKGRTYYPLLVEYYLQQFQSISVGTILLKNDQLYIVIKPKQDLIDATTRSVIAEFLPEATLKILQSFPMDPRHHSKIDYDKLMECI